MFNLRKSIEDSISLLLNNCKYFDLLLSNDKVFYEGCADLSEAALFGFVFNEVGQICSSLTYPDAISFNYDLPDYYLTAIDNRQISSFTPTSFNPQDTTNFCVYPVSGSFYTYDIFPNQYYADLCGGFYQGFYKLDGHPYNLIPESFAEGWSFDFWLNPKDTLCNSGDTSGTTLNHTFEDNKGIFFYWGVRSENKYCNPFDGELGQYTSSGTSLHPILVEHNDNQNKFLTHNRNACEPKVAEKTFEYVEDCCDGLADNAFAFRVTDLGEIETRLLTKSGDCVEKTFRDFFILDQYVTNENVIKKNVWSNVHIKWIPYEVKNCTNGKRLGKLQIYVNGLLVQTIPNFKEYTPYRLNTSSDKQLTVPFNMSFGGGTQSQLENLTFGGHDEGLATPETTQYRYRFILKKNTAVTICGQTLDDDWNFVDLNESLRNCFDLQPIISIIERESYFEVAITSEFSLDFTITQNDCIIDVCPEEITVLGHLGKCGILEEHFAGSFIGGFGLVRMFPYPLCFQDIQCNYNLIKQLYE